jgi:hypothetical protein
MNGGRHLSDQDLLRLADGELRRPFRRAQRHMAACLLCRSRLSELSATMSGFVSLYQQAEVPSHNASPALLKARLAKLRASEPRAWGFLPPWFAAPARAATAAVLSLVLLSTGVLLRGWHANRPKGEPPAEATLIPDPELTPGAVRNVALGDVCTMRHEAVVAAVPDSLRDTVFREYGIVDPRPQDYEIDYLIAPGLGGTQDIHNLWPEPSSSAGWNAHVKDALEERLHQMVCNGELDLPTAQREIARDWILAYRKYLGTAARL